VQNNFFTYYIAFLLTYIKQDLDTGVVINLDDIAAADGTTSDAFYLFAI